MAVAMVLVAACGSAPPSAGETDVAAPATTPAESAAAQPPSAAPTSPDQTPSVATPAALDFNASLVGGGQIEGGDLAGRDVVLWFWAPW